MKWYLFLWRKSVAPTFSLSTRLRWQHDWKSGTIWNRCTSEEPCLRQPRKIKERSWCAFAVTIVTATCAWLLNTRKSWLQWEHTRSVQIERTRFFWFSGVVYYKLTSDHSCIDMERTLRSISIYWLLQELHSPPPLIKKISFSISLIVVRFQMMMETFMKIWWQPMKCHSRQQSIFKSMSVQIMPKKIFFESSFLSLFPPL